MQESKRKGLTDMHTDLAGEQEKLQKKVVLNLDPEDSDEVEM